MRERALGVRAEAGREWIGTALALGAGFGKAHSTVIMDSAGKGLSDPHCRMTCRRRLFYRSFGQIEPFHERTQRVAFVFP